MEPIEKMPIGTNQLVTFWLENEEFAVPIGIVQEIIKRPDIRRVPNAPVFLEGIGNLRGHVLPIVNLRIKLALTAREADENTRIVVLNIGGIPTGLVVDRVSEVLRIDQACMEAPQRSMESGNGSILRAVAKIDDGKRIILILDEYKLLPELESLAREKDQVRSALTAEHTKPDRADLEQVVTFKIGNEEFSLNIMEVQEIIRITSVTPVPHSPESIVGIMSLRNHLLPILDLRIRFGMASLKDLVKVNNKTELLDSQRIVVADLGGYLLGILVDSVSQVLCLDKSQIEAPPQIISVGHAKRVKGVGMLDRGNRLVMLIDLETLLSEDERKNLAKSAEERKMATENVLVIDKGLEEEIQLVAFRIAHEEYAIPIVKVQEIIKIKQITSVPQTKSYIDGIINLRGHVVPLIDLRARFGIERKADLEHRRIVVVHTNGKITGFIVDSVTEVLRMRKSQIEMVPASIGGGIDSSFVDGIGKLNDGKRIIIMVNPDAILIDSAGAEVRSITPAPEAKVETEQRDILPISA